MDDLIDHGDLAPAQEVWMYPLRKGDRLANHDWFPFHGHQFLGSRFLALCNHAGRRDAVATALILWCESMRLDPAGTLPDDDLELAQLAKYGADIEAWRDVRDLALHGWRRCYVDVDGETVTMLGHPIIAKNAADMMKRSKGRKAGQEIGRLHQRRTRVRKKLADLKVRKAIQESPQVVDQIAEFLGEQDLYVTAENVRMALQHVVGFSENVTPFIGGKP